MRYSAAFSKLRQYSDSEEVAEGMVDDRQQQTGENGPVPKFILVLVLPVGVHDRQAHQCGTVDHQPAAEARQHQNDEIVVGDQAEEIA